METVTNRYQLEEKLGQGGMGAVFLATDRLSGQAVALKQVYIALEQLSWLSQSSVDQTIDDLRFSLAQEFRILAGLRHPNIISVLDYGFDFEQMPFYTMDYLPEAQTVVEAAADRDLVGKLDLVHQILQALTYLHRRQVLHRDLKPNNILYSGERVLLVDFGLSSYTGENGSSGGTLRYMSPEVLVDAGTPFVEASDLYSIGVMMYQMLSGEHPFDVRSEDFAHQVINDPPDLDKLGVETSLAGFVGRLLAKKPSERYADAGVCLVAFNEALGQLTTDVALPQTAPSEQIAIRESYLQTAAFVGRDKELTTLKSALEAAASSASSAWLIGGESGVGKSRLIDELRIYGLVNGWQVLRGQAVAQGGMPYQIWQNIIPHLVLSTFLSDLEVGILRQIAPAIDHLLSREVPDAPDLKGNAAQQRLGDTLVTILQRQIQPTLIVIDDVHWVRETLASLKTVIGAIARIPNVMIVGTYRDDERPGLPEELPEAQTLALDRLSEAETLELSQAMLGEAGRSPNIVSLLTQETEGNTFFIVEVMRALAEEAGSLDEVGEMSLPEGVFTQGMQHLLQRRIQRLPQNDQPLLRLAAVAGRQLDLALLRTLTPTQDLEGWLQRAGETSILAIQEETWVFAHDKLRETILASTTDQVRQDLHRQVAQAIETLYPNDRGYDHTLLEHWHQAGNLDKELYYLELVAQRLIEAVGDDIQAIDLLNRGLQQLQDADPRRIPFLNWLSTAYINLRQMTQAKTSAQQAQQLASQSDDKPGLATSLYHLGTIFRHEGNTTEALEYHQRSLIIRQTSNNQKEVAASLHNIGMVLEDMGDNDQATDYFEQSLAIRRAIQDHTNISTMIHIAWQAYARGDFDQARRYYEEFLAIAQKTGHQRYIANNLQGLGFVALAQGEFAQAQDYFEQSLQIQQPLQNYARIGHLFNNLGSAVLGQGKFELARSYYQQALDVSPVAGHPGFAFHSLNGLGSIAYREGDYQQARDYFQQGFAMGQTIGAKRTDAQSLNYLGYTYLQLGDEIASTLFKEALIITQSLQAIPILLEVILGFAGIYLRQNRISDAGTLFGLVLHYPQSVNTDVKARLDELRPQLETVIPSADRKALYAQGKDLELDTVVQELLDAFADIPPFSPDLISNR